MNDTERIAALEERQAELETELVATQSQLAVILWLHAELVWGMKTAAAWAREQQARQQERLRLVAAARKQQPQPFPLPTGH